MHRKKYILFTLLLSTVLLLQSCGIIVLHDSTADTTSPEETDTETTVPVTDAVTSVPVHKLDKSEEYEAISDAYLQRITEMERYYNGETFFIATPRASMIDGEEGTGSYYETILKRNSRLEEALNIRVMSSVTDEASFFDLLNASILADEYFADLLLIPENQIGTFAAGGVLMNLRSMPLLDLSQPYFYSDSVEAASAANVTYAAAGAASFEETSLSAVYFNRDLFEENGVEIPYDMVYEGTWTWDAFFTSCAETNGINTYASTHGIERFSSYSTQYAAELLPAMVYVSSGASLVRSVSGESPVVGIGDSDNKILDVIVQLYSDKNAHRDYASGVSRFHTGKSLYLIDRLYLMSWMPGSPYNWGILPLPKADSKQDSYHTLADSSTLFFAVQKNITDAEKSSIVLSALNAASYGVLSESYVDYAMNYLLRDNDSANMLAIISASRTFDFALAFENTTKYLTDATTGGLADLAAGLARTELFARVSSANRQLASRFPASNS